MWHQPRTLNLLSSLLIFFGVAALLFALAAWALRLPFQPVRLVILSDTLQQVKVSEVESALDGKLGDNFFRLNPEEIQLVLEQLPWVRHADVRKLWPAHLEVSIEEHVPAALWGEKGDRLVNTHGEVFNAMLPKKYPNTLPHFIGPDGNSFPMLERYKEISKKLAPLGLAPQQLVLSSRLAWQIQLEDGLLIDLGREQTKSPISQRIDRFVEIYKPYIMKRDSRPRRVDLRYLNGFVLQIR